MTIFASEKPKYPVIDPNPSMGKVVDNFNTSDHFYLSTFTASSVSFAYGAEFGATKGLKRAFYALGKGVFVGLMIGFPIACFGSSARLQGFSRNEAEVARYKYVNSDNAALVKPKYLVVDPNPPFTKVVGNFNIRDYCLLASHSCFLASGFYGLANIIPPVGNVKPPIMATSLGFSALMLALNTPYEMSADRLKGFRPNEEEIARYSKVKTDSTMAVDSDEEFAGQLDSSFPNEEVDQDKK